MPTTEPPRSSPHRHIVEVLREYTMVLSEAGIDTPRRDVELLAAHILNVPLGRLGVLSVLGEEFTEEQQRLLDDHVRQRALRVPVQYLTGYAPFYGLELLVGPGVFIPRPETERLVETSLEIVRGQRRERPNELLTIVDLCTGSGAIICAIAAELSVVSKTAKKGPLADLRLIAVERDPVAFTYAQKNAEDFDIELYLGDATHIENIPELAVQRGKVDVVISNPPYIPEGRVLQFEAAQDPNDALYGGSADGLAIPLLIAQSAAVLLKPGGQLLMEHDDTHASSLAQRLTETGDWHQIEVHRDLTGSDRFTTAVRLSEARPGITTAMTVDNGRMTP